MRDAPAGRKAASSASAAPVATASVRERRADARRNIAAILDAAVDCLARDPQASIADIAAAAGVGRITLYGHFSSRAELVDAAFGHAINQADAVLSAVDLSGDPRDALARLVAPSWQIVDKFRGSLAAAERELPPERIRAHHSEPMSRVGALIGRGQSEGAFRSDLPLEWLVALFYTVMHGAAAEITAGRLSSADAARVITATLLSAYAPPAAT
jgi:TetR/AcrR family transcriptional regulator, mexCD-oprJ operon repressor